MSIVENAAKIIFWGTPYFGAKILESLIRANFRPILVVTAPDKPKGRELEKQASEVKRMAIKHGLGVSQPTKLRENEAFWEQLRSLGPDLFVVASYGKIIPKEVLAIPKKGCLNVHPSLLPRWRGASPIQATILNNDEETGAAIMLMDEEMDHGNIVASSKLKTQISKLSYKKLEEKLIEESAKLLLETLPKWLNGRITPLPQDHSKATFCKIIKKEDGKIDFGEPAEILERKIRALNPWPGTFFEINKKNYKILEAEMLKDAQLLRDKGGGEFFCYDKNLIVKCGQDGLIIKKIQPESKKPLSGYEFWCGYQKKLKI
jgi:methionyl-tRNA formyltransferase